MLLKEIAVIGGGIIGSTTAFNLAKTGHKVTLIDTNLNKSQNSDGLRSGSYASLGVLMGNTFSRSSGRSWLLRQKSMEIWPEWIEEISTKNNILQLQKPLIKLAVNDSEKIRYQILCKEKTHLGLKFFERKFKKVNNTIWPNYKYGGIISLYDGRINPSLLMQSLMLALEKLQVERINKKVLYINRLSKLNISKWRVNIEENNSLISDYVIICASLDSQDLIKPLGHDRPMEPILGQAIEINLENDNQSLESWPSVLSSNGVNLIPNGRSKMLVGATLEPGEMACEDQLKKMQNLYGNAPEWLQKAQILHKWHGIRARPTKQAAPLLETLEPGLIINSGHYRNGILLAPACAEWVAKEIV